MISSERSATTLPPGLAGRLNPVCDRFEAQWLAGATPRLEEFLPLVDDADRPALVREMLELERHYRGQRGENATAEEYRQRLPQYAGIIAAVLPEMAAAQHLTPRPKQAGAETVSQPPPEHVREEDLLPTVSRLPGDA